MNIFGVSSKILCYLFLCLIHGNDLKISGPLLVEAGCCDWLTNRFRGSSTTDSDNSKSSTSPGGSEFELNIKSSGDELSESTSAGGSSPEGSSEDQSAQAKPGQKTSAEGDSTTPKPSGGGSSQPKSSGGSVDNDKYKLESHGNYKNYNFKSGAKCKAIKVEDQEVWKYDSSKGTSKYPNYITCDNYERIYIGFTDQYLSYQKNTDGTWTAVTNSTQQSGRRV